MLPACCYRENEKYVPFLFLFVLISFFSFYLDEILLIIIKNKEEEHIHTLNLLLHLRKHTTANKPKKKGKRKDFFLFFYFYALLCFASLWENPISILVSSLSFFFPLINTRHMLILHILHFPLLHWIIACVMHSFICQRWRIFKSISMALVRALSLSVFFSSYCSVSYLFINFALISFMGLF